MNENLATVMRNIQKSKNEDELDFLRSVFSVLAMDLDSVQNLIAIEFLISVERANEILAPLGLRIIEGSYSKYLTWVLSSPPDEIRK